MIDQLITETGRGTLNFAEPHPSAHDAMSFIKRLSANQLLLAREAFASCAIENNRLGEVCGETLRRVMEGEPVSDRYLLGLAWTLRKTFGEEEGGFWG